jgi:hypothetical protein
VVVDLAHHHRHVAQLGQLRRAPAAFAGDDLVTLAADRTHHDGLDHALGAQRVGQLLQAGLIHVAARLVLAGLQGLDRQRTQAFAGGRGFRLGRRAAEQLAEAATEAAFLGGHQWVSWAAPAWPRSRRSISPARPR